MKIVSLLPSATEIVAFLDRTEDLVAVSHDCDFPPSIDTLPEISSTKIPEEADSAQIDRSVKDLQHQGKSIYHLNEQQLKQLDPDLILTQELCDVCAPSFDHVRNAVKVQQGSPQIISLEPTTIDDIFETIRTVGKAMDSFSKAESKVQQLQAKIKQLQQIVTDHRQHHRTFCLEWLNPPYTAGHWVPEMVRIAGGTPFTNPGTHSRECSWETIKNYDPSYLFFMPCGFSIDRTEQEIDDMKNRGQWPPDPSLHKIDSYLVDGSSFFNRPGPRILQGIRILAAAFHPHLYERFDLTDNHIKAYLPS